MSRDLTISPTHRQIRRRRATAQTIAALVILVGGYWATYAVLALAVHLGWCA